jgi:hypothetical protein
LGIGGALIVAVMLAAMLLPRPNAEFAISELPFRIGSPDQHSSPYGMGRDGVKEKKPWARGDPSDEKPSDSAASDQAGKAPTPNPQVTLDGKKVGREGSSPQSGGQRQSKQKTSGQQTAPGKQGEQSHQPAQNRNAQQRQNETGQRQAETGDQSQAGAKSQAAGKSQPSGKSQAGAKPQAGDRPKDTGQTQSEKGVRQQASGGPHSPKPPDQKPADKTNEPQPANKGGGSAPRQSILPHLPTMSFSPLSLLGAFKWLIYLGIAILAAYGIWSNRDRLSAALSNLGQWWQEFWGRLFGSRRGARTIAAADETGPHSAPLPRFVDFADPFAAGIAARYPPEELVRYSFEALEAWGRDHGCPREPDQTPHEFTRQLAANVSPLAEEAQRLADLYCRVAYADGGLSATSVQRLSHLWQIMATENVWSA